jgi:hypothetical protein
MDVVRNDELEGFEGAQITTERKGHGCTATGAQRGFLFFLVTNAVKRPWSVGEQHHKFLNLGNSQAVQPKIQYISKTTVFLHKRGSIAIGQPSYIFIDLIAENDCSS